MEVQESIWAWNESMVREDPWNGEESDRSFFFWFGGKKGNVSYHAPSAVRRRKWDSSAECRWVGVPIC